MKKKVQLAVQEGHLLGDSRTEYMYCGHAGTAHAAETKCDLLWGPPCYRVQTFACFLAAALFCGTVGLSILVTGCWVGCQIAPT